MMTSRYRWIHLFMRIRAPCFLIQWQREEGENQEVEFLTWLWVFDSASSPEYNETTPPDSSRERGNARAKKDCKVKQEKFARRGFTIQGVLDYPKCADFLWKKITA